MEGRQRGLGATREGVLLKHPFEGRPERELAGQRILLHLLDGCAADPAGWSVDDAEQADGILGADQDLHIREDVLDLGALIEAEAADDDVLAPVAAQRLFNLARLRIGSIQDRYALGGLPGKMFFDGIR